MDYQLRSYQPGDEQGILDTFNLVFREVCGEGYVDRGLDFWRWEFEQCPFGHRITLAFTPEGSVAAQYAGVVYPMTTNFGDCNFVHIVDSMVHPEHRAGLKRPGLFVNNAMPWFKMCWDAGDAVMYGYPVKTAERIGQRYLEYKTLRVVDYLCLDVAAANLAMPAGMVVEQVSQFPAEVDALFDTMAANKGCLTTRRRPFLDWRWSQVPGGAETYQILVAKDDAGAPRGVCVLRPSHELVPNCACIADWVVPETDSEARAALLATATQRAVDGGRAVLMAVFPDQSPEQAALRKAGFEVVPSGTFMERRLTHRIYHGQMTTEWLQEHWWYTLGDSDLV